MHVFNTAEIYKLFERSGYSNKTKRFSCCNTIMSIVSMNFSGKSCHIMFKSICGSNTTNNSLFKSGSNNRIKFKCISQ